MRKLFLALATMAFMAGPRLVLLDEPAGGVNPTMLADFRARLYAINQERGATFVVIEHEVNVTIASAHTLTRASKTIPSEPPRKMRTNREITDTWTPRSLQTD